MADVASLQVVVGADTSDAEKGLASLGSKVESFGSGVAKAFGGAAIAGVVGFGAAIAGSVKEAADFEKQISAIGAVSGATSDQLKEISNLALQLGKDTSFSASEAAQGIEELTKAGVSMADIMGGAAKASLDLAAAGGVSVADAAEIASNAMNVFNKTGADMAHIADVIAGAANASAIDVTDYKFALSAAGSVAATVGLSFDDLSVAIAEMGQAGIKGSDAGTSLKTMMLALQPQTKDQIKLFDQLGLTTMNTKVGFDTMVRMGMKPASESTADLMAAMEDYLGIGHDTTKWTESQKKSLQDLERQTGLVSNAFFDQTGKVKSLGEVQQILQDALKGQTEQQKLATLQTLFGTDAIRAAAVMAKNGAEGFSEMADAMGKVSAADVGEARLNNLEGSLEKLKGSIETVMIMIGTAFLPVLKQVVDAATNIVNAWMPTVQAFAEQVPAAIQATVTAITASLEPALTWLATTGWAMLQAAMDVVVTYIGGILVPTLTALWTWLSPNLNAALTWLAVTGMPTLLSAMTAVATWVQTTYIPILTSLWSWLSEKVGAALTWLKETGWPAMGNAANAVQNWIEQTLKPTLSTLWDWLSPKIGDALSWLRNTGWPKLQEAMTAVWGWIEQTLVPVLSTVYDWLAPKFQYAMNWLVITGWPTLQTAMNTVWQWLNDTFVPVLAKIYDWLAPKFQEAINWLVITGWPQLQAAATSLYGEVSKLEDWFGRLFVQLDKRSFFVELKSAWDDLVAVGDKLAREILNPLVTSTENVTTATGDATDSADDYAGALVGLVQDIHTVITWLDHLLDMLILSIDGWKALGKAAQWAAAAAGAKITGGDVPDFPTLTRRPTWLDQAPDASAPPRHRGTPSGSGGGGSTSPPASAPPSSLPSNPPPSNPPANPPPSNPPPGADEPTGMALIRAIDDIGAGMGGVDFGHAAAAIAKSEGADGDLSKKGAGGARGPFQFDPGGELIAYANYLGMSMSAAGDYAGSHPMEAATWALQGYLGNALRAGMGKGLRGWTLANYGSRYGQRPQGSEIDDPNNPGAYWARAGRWHLDMFGYASGGWAGLHGPEIGVLGERGPEYVIPNRALHSGGAASQMTINLSIGGRVAEQIVVEGYDLAMRRGRVPIMRLAGT